MDDEIKKIENRYEKRKKNSINKSNDLYFNYFFQVERELKYLEILRYFFQNTNSLSIIEIGAGNGNNLFFFLKNGILSKNIYANELLEDRLKLLRKSFSCINIFPGNALNLKFKNKFDIVFQSTVFTSVLDSDFKKKLAEKMWEMKNKNGIILWYDFIYDNPFNKDVKGITKNEIKDLFPMASKVIFYKTTLAPPFGKRIKKLYNLFNFLLPFLRTHVIAVIK
ncbi:MAG: class I SAM-dependent methyltransferase [Spirochaetes bacterium]|nr:class I SAM-dependent methyltransferase [Spirochaetota bacterium]